jgi:hypothetical protein
MIRTAVGELAEPYRTAIHLRYYEGLDPHEIAAQLNVPVETVRTRIKRGLRLLEEDLRHKFGGEPSTAFPAWFAWLGRLRRRVGRWSGPSRSSVRALSASLLAVFLVLGFLRFGSTRTPEDGRDRRPSSMDRDLFARADLENEATPVEARRPLAAGSALNTLLADTRPIGSLEGRVVESGQAASAADVSVWAGPPPVFEDGLEPPPLFRTLSDSTGHFRADGLPKEFYIRVRRAELVGAEDVIVNLEHEDAVHDLELRLVHPHTIQGRVTDPSDRPVENAFVECVGGAAGDNHVRAGTTVGVWYVPQTHITTHTDSGGRFRFDEVTNPSLKLAVRAPGVSIHQIEVAKDQEAVDIRLPDSVDCEAVVREPDGRPAASAHVLLYTTGRDPRVGTTDASGRFHWNGLPPRILVILRVEAPGFASYISPLTELRPGLTTIDARLEQARLLRGRVSTPDGTPVSDCDVRVQAAGLRIPGTEMRWATHAAIDAARAFPPTRTDADGRFAVEGAPGSPLRVEVIPPDPSQRPTYVTLRTSDAPVEIVLGRGDRDDTVIRGRIVDQSSGSPLGTAADAHVLAFETSGEIRTVHGFVDADGRFEVSVPNPSLCTLCTWARGFAARLVQPAHASDMSAVEVRLSTPRSLKLRIIDANGDLLEHGLLLVEDESGEPMPVMLTAKIARSFLSTGSGEVNLEGLYGTKVKLTVYPSGLIPPHRREFELSSSGDDPAEWALEDVNLRAPRIPTTVILQQPTVRIYSGSDVAPELRGALSRVAKGRVDVLDALGRIILSWTFSSADGACRVDPELRGKQLSFFGPDRSPEFVLDLPVSVSGGFEQERGISVDSSRSAFRFGLPLDAVQIAVALEGWDDKLAPVHLPSNGAGVLSPMEIVIPMSRHSR